MKNSMTKTYNITKGLGVAAVGVVMTFGIGSAEAAPTPVAGVIVDTDTTFLFSNITETFVDQPGEELSGFGEVTRINNLDGTAYCANGPCELTYAFSGYTVTSINTEGAENNIVFDGGTASLYLDTTPDSNLQTTSGFTDGTLWLTLSGFRTTQTTGPNAGAEGTLFGVGTDFADAQNIAGTGTGLLEITGGAAADFFGTNRAITVSSSFQPSIGPFVLPISGTNEFQISAELPPPPPPPPVTVPEPATLALLGIGLLGLGGVSRMRRQGIASI